MILFFSWFHLFVGYEITEILFLKKRREMTQHQKVTYDKEVESLLQDRIVREKHSLPQEWPSLYQVDVWPCREYLVKWKGKACPIMKEVGSLKKHFGCFTSKWKTSNRVPRPGLEDPNPTIQGNKDIKTRRISKGIFPRASKLEERRYQASKENMLASWRSDMCTYLSRWVCTYQLL